MLVVRIWRKKVWLNSLQCKIRFILLQYEELDQNKWLIQQNPTPTRPLLNQAETVGANHDSKQFLPWNYMFMVSISTWLIVFTLRLLLLLLFFIRGALLATPVYNKHFAFGLQPEMEIRIYLNIWGYIVRFLYNTL